MITESQATVVKTPQITPKKYKNHNQLANCFVTLSKFDFIIYLYLMIILMFSIHIIN